jgi:hypothetical protein
MKKFKLGLIAGVMAVSFSAMAAFTSGMTAANCFWLSLRGAGQRRPNRQFGQGCECLDHADYQRHDRAGNQCFDGADLWPLPMATKLLLKLRASEKLSEAQSAAIAGADPTRHGCRWCGSGAVKTGSLS